MSSNSVAITAGTSNSTPANCNTNPKFPNTAFTGGLKSRGVVAVAFRIMFAIVD